jgi:glucokinase
MSTAIGVVMTEHIVAGALEDQRLTGKPLRFPDDKEELRRAAGASQRRTG